MSVGQAQAFNEKFNRALDRVMSELGRQYPYFIGHEERTSDRTPFEDRSPNDARLLVGTFQECREPEADAAVGAARTAFEAWSHTPWQERITVMRRAAENFRTRKYEIGAWLAVEAGKARLEAMG